MKGQWYGFDCGVTVAWSILKYNKVNVTYETLLKALKVCLVDGLKPTKFNQEKNIKNLGQILEFLDIIRIMGYKNLYKKTTNRSEFNRAYKYHLEHSGKIRCSYCQYHHNENRGDNKYYGGYDSIRYPNWKLVSKQSKQWMKKPIKIKTRYYGKYTKKYTDIIW